MSKKSNVHDRRSDVAKRVKTRRRKSDDPPPDAKTPDGNNLTSKGFEWMIDQMFTVLELPEMQDHEPQTVEARRLIRLVIRVATNAAVKARRREMKQ
jgi:hypothetical protein